MQLVLTIIAEGHNSTASKLERIIDDKTKQFVCFVIEDGYRKTKIKGETRIPAGDYIIKPRQSGRHYEQYKNTMKHNCTYQVMNVPEFEYIMVHIGNTPKDTEGCLLVNSNIMYDGREFSGSGSKTAYMKFYELLQKVDENETITIKITR